MSTTTLSLDDLLALRHQTPTLAKPTRFSQGSTYGPFPSRYRGQGLDFDDLRQYYPGDDVRHIDWKVTARHQQTMTRLFSEERDSTITLAVDFRRLMHTGTKALRAVIAGRLAAALAWYAVNRGQRVAVLALTDNHIYSSLPLNGESGALKVCRTLCDAFPLESSTMNSLTDQSYSLNSLLDALLLGGRRVGSTVLMTGFDDLFDNSSATNLMQNMAVLQNKYQHHSQTLCAIQILDHAETAPLPPGRYGYRIASTQTASTKNKSSVRKLHSSQRDALEKILKEQMQRVTDLCNEQNINCINHTGPTTEASISEIIRQLTNYSVLK